MERCRRVEQNVSIRTDRLKDRVAGLRFAMRLKQKLSIIKVKEESNEQLWTEFQEGILSTAVEACGVKRYKGQRKRTRWWNEKVKKTVKKK